MKKFRLSIPIILILLILGSCMEKKLPQEIPELEWIEENSFRWAKLPVIESDKYGFQRVPSSFTGITFNNQLSDDQAAGNRIYLNGSGVAAGDVTGNGYVDLYFTSLMGSNKLYQNLGNFNFEDITEKAGVKHSGFLSTGSVFADVNGNGKLDLLITSLNKKNSLYLNNGDGTFTYVEDSGFGLAEGSTTMALTDISGNGYPDLYIVKNKHKSPRDLFDIQNFTKENFFSEDGIRPPYDQYYRIVSHGNKLSVREIGEKDELYFNIGDGSFRKVNNPEDYFFASDGSKLGLDLDWGLSAKFRDLNNDGLQDLYVANDFWTPDRIWINQGDNTFRALDTLSIPNLSYSSMEVDFTDVDQNGTTDIFVLDMLDSTHEVRMLHMIPEEPFPLEKGNYKYRPQYNRNSFYYNRGDTTFAEISYLMGLQASEWSWATEFVDIDLDGFEDVIVSNGYMFDLQNIDAQREASLDVENEKLTFKTYILGFPNLPQRNRIFRNDGDLTFNDMSENWGFRDKDISQGMVTADLDNDGDLDLVINRMNDEAALFNNIGDADRLAIRLVGSQPNSQAIGAKLRLIGGEIEKQYKEISSGGDYLSGSDPLVVFAANKENKNQVLNITWPDGSLSTIDSLKSNRIYEIYEDSTKKKLPKMASDKNRSIQTLFEDKTTSLSHIHHENQFEDFSIQPLLPYRLSQMGPGISWIDIIGDDSEELLIGSGRNGKMGVYKVEDNSDFSSIDIGRLGSISPGDQTSIVGWKTQNLTHIILGVANYEIGRKDVPSAIHFKFQEGTLIETNPLPANLSSTGPIAVADYTGDGKIDVFIGGRFIPGQYPRDASSKLYRNDNGNLIQDPDNNKLLNDLGLVTSALFIDYNLNGQQDLIVTTEWGTLQLFENRDGTFIDRTTDLGLDEYSGWWQGIATGDFTGNGYPDIVVTNIGENSLYQLYSDQKPLKLFYDDFTGNKSVEILDTYFDNSTGGYVPRRQFQDYAAIKHLFDEVDNNTLFANSTVDDLLNIDSENLPQKKINTLKHLIFLNSEGESFEAKPLPTQTQFTASFYAGTADVDNDGYEDIFLSQNFFAFANPQKTPRLDSGRGIWLKGDGTGNFKVVPGHISGVKVYGEQRGAALGDYNKDGKIDLVVSQNATKTRVFENQSDKRGIRVKLVGPDDNLNGIGSTIRLVYKNGEMGPAKYIQAGSGYWSQNSAVPILGISGDPEAIKVRWADGVDQLYKFKEGQMDYKLKYQSK